MKYPISFGRKPTDSISWRQFALNPHILVSIQNVITLLYLTDDWILMVNPGELLNSCRADDSRLPSKWNNNTAWPVAYFIEYVNPTLANPPPNFSEGVAKIWIAYSIAIPGYQCFHFPRIMKYRCAKRDSGGMLILVSDALHKYVRLRRESDSIVWLQLQGKCLSLPYDINIGVVYILPEDIPYADADDLGNLCKAIIINLKVAEYLFMATLTHTRVK